ncbi:MAG: glycosyltransferase family A protein [Ferruginibacter sp.]
MQSPMVSVLMTAYNREKYIAEAITSVLSSTYTNFELIIVDDCSSDKTVTIAREFEAKDCRVKLYVNDKNLGDYPNRNKAAGYATGVYLVSVDSDDMIFKDGIETCISYMLQFPQARFATYYCLPAREAFVMDSVTAIQNHFFKQQFLIVGPGGLIVERTYFIEIGGFPEKYGPANDMYYNLKAVCSSPVLLIPFEFFYYRRHPEQEIHNLDSYLYNSYRLNRDAFNELNLPLQPEQIRWLQKKNKRRFVVNIFKYLRRTKDFKKTILAIRYAKFSLKDALVGTFH